MKRARAAKVAEFLLLHPESYDQGTWFSVPYGDDLKGKVEPAKPWTCGATACVAGWAAVLSGATVAQHADGDWMDGIVLKDGVQHDVQTVAQEWLDLDYNEADWLFSGGRTREQVLGFLATGSIDAANATAWFLNG